METARIYLAPYHAASARTGGNPCGGEVAALERAIGRNEWPYDNGDDPSFYAMREFGGQLTWGICRQDVRNRIKVSDIVVFFSFRKEERTDSAEYRLCAVATVEEKVAHTDLWSIHALRHYTKYFNLLIRPAQGSPRCWEHHEPSLTRDRLHKDWLWRISDHRGLRKKEFDRLHAAKRFCDGEKVGGRPLLVAENHVIFSGDPCQTCILQRPPVVAWYTKGKPAEEWKRDSFSQAIRRLTLGESARVSGQRRSLRIQNSQRAHRHIVFEMPSVHAHDWRSEILLLIGGR